MRVAGTVVTILTFEALNFSRAAVRWSQAAVSASKAVGPPDASVEIVIIIIVKGPLYLSVAWGLRWGAIDLPAKIC